MNELLSLCVICRDDAANVTRLVTSARPVVGEIVIVDTGSVDGSADAARKAGADIVVEAPQLLDSEGTLRSFAEARNMSYALATRPWQIWLDTDDDLSDWSALSDAVTGANRVRAEKPGFNVCLWYDYTWTPDRTRCTQSYTRKRLTYRADGWTWRRPIHEHIYRPDDRPDLLAQCIQPRVIHLSEGARGIANDRNLKILRRWEAEGGVEEDQDALYYYLGDEMMQRRQNQEAIDYFSRVRYNPNNPHWRDRAVFRSARTMCNDGRFAEAATLLMDSIKVNPRPAHHYWELARAVARMGDRNLARVIMERSKQYEPIMGEDPALCQMMTQALGIK